MTSTPPKNPTQRLAPGTPVVHLGEAGTIVRVCTYRRNGQDAWSYLVATAHGPEIWNASTMVVQTGVPAAPPQIPVDPNALAAPQVYHAHRAAIARLLDLLQMELEEHAAGAQADPKNWGHAGDLAKVQSDLVDLVVFLSGQEKKQVEELLAE